MNSYSKTLNSAFAEIDSFEKTDEGKKWDSGWYQQIRDLVTKTKEENTDDGAERYLDMLLHCIVDSGPLGKGFAPSINQAADAMQRKRKSQFKARRIAKTNQAEQGGAGQRR